MVRNLGELGIDLQKIITRLQANQSLLKLLYYTDKDPLSGADLTETQIQNEIFNKLIRIVPRVPAPEDAQSIISVKVVSGQKDNSNTEFRNLVITVEVFVPMTQWIIKNSNLRPFAILGEVQNSINNKIINGLGKLVGGDFDLVFLTDEMSCYMARYELIDYV